LAQSAAKPPRILRISGEGAEVIARSQSEVLPAAFLSQPEAITWQSSDGAAVHGLYYPPANPDYEAAGAPPVIVYIHGRTYLPGFMTLSTSRRISSPAAAMPSWRSTTAAARALGARTARRCATTGGG